jgi:hypothetical protein
MPQPRFVEVVDVSAEASSTIAALLASGQGLVGKLSFNVTDYLNSTYGREALMKQLGVYNITPNWDDFQWVGLADSLNISAPDVPAPRGAARHLLIVGLAMLMSRELVLRWRVTRLLRRYGHHA